jgi:hypothetical protein
MNFFRLIRGTLLAATALGCVLMACIGIPQAQAQFVCGGSPTGNPPQFGALATAAGGNNLACGPFANASGNSVTAGINTAIGGGTNASGGTVANPSNNTATGGNADAHGTGSGNTATGQNSNASGDSSFNTATGQNSNASGAGSSNVAIGKMANASGAGTTNTAVGANSVATGTNSAAFGAGASATFANSAAFGNGAVTTQANQQMFGTASNSYTMAGLTTTSTAAQTGPLQIVTSDASGTLGTNTAAGLGLATTSQISGINSQLGVLSNQVGLLSNQVGLLSNQINDVNKEARRGIAATAAMAYAPTPTAPGRTTLAINGSVYEDTGGVGVAFQHRFAGTRIPVYFSGAYGNGGGREHVGRAGFAVEF